MDWTKVTEESPPANVRLHIYDAMHVGKGTGHYDGEKWVVDGDHKGTFVTHWAEETPTSRPDPSEVHKVCKTKSKY